VCLLSEPCRRQALSSQHLPESYEQVVQAVVKPAVQCDAREKSVLTFQKPLQQQQQQQTHTLTPEWQLAFACSCRYQGGGPKLQKGFIAYSARQELVCMLLLVITWGYLVRTATCMRCAMSCQSAWPTLQWLAPGRGCYQLPPR
jgi:hypothetical protein